MCDSLMYTWEGGVLNPGVVDGRLHGVGAAAWNVGDPAVGGLRQDVEGDDRSLQDTYM